MKYDAHEKLVQLRFDIAMYQLPRISLFKRSAAALRQNYSERITNSWTYQESTCSALVTRPSHAPEGSWWWRHNWAFRWEEKFNDTLRHKTLHVWTVGMEITIDSGLKNYASKPRTSFVYINRSTCRSQLWFSKIPKSKIVYLMDVVRRFKCGTVMQDAVCSLHLATFTQTWPAQTH